MAKKQPKKRPKAKGPAPRKKNVDTPRKMSVSQIAMLVVGILVILSMTVGLLLSAFSTF